MNASRRLAQVVIDLGTSDFNQTLALSVNVTESILSGIESRGAFGTLK